MRQALLTILLIVAVSLAVALADVQAAEAQSYPSESCEASWYGPGLYGNPTASGTIFYGQAGYAAHPWLPFGTEVYVVSEYGAGTVIINDRGPFVAGRCLDISEGSNWLVGGGVAWVELYY
jgi:rare lipoprotein A